MPMRYAVLEDVLHDLQIDAEDTETIDRVTRLESALVDAFTAKTGVQWVTPGTLLSRTFMGLSTDHLIIHEGIRVVTGIEIDGDPLPADGYRLAFLQDGVAYGIYLNEGYWHGDVTVTGYWGAEITEAVPADVAHALTILTVKEYRRLTSSPMEQVGPDGQIVSTPSGWNDPTVKAAIEAHTLTRILV